MKGGCLMDCGGAWRHDVPTEGFGSCGMRGGGRVTRADSVRSWLRLRNTHFGFLERVSIIGVYSISKTEQMMYRAPLWTW